LRGLTAGEEGVKFSEEGVNFYMAFSHR